MQRDSLTPRPGSLIAGRYRVDRPLGKGGMAIVVGATDEQTFESVAVKLMQETGAGDTERFIREAKVSQKLASEHIAKFIDVGSAEGQLYIVMERLNGYDYGQRVRENGPLEVTEVADCVVQACEALAHAHAHGVIHRDIKASNLFLHQPSHASTGSIVKVLDFGVSKVLSDASIAERTLTPTGESGVLGSPPYMSPEHVRNPRSVDASSDLWSLGVVTHRLLSGKLPFPGASTGETFALILESDPPTLASLGITVPPEVQAAISRCLRRSRAERFGDAGELAQALAPFLSPRWRDLPSRIESIVAKGGPRRRAHDEPRTETAAQRPSQAPHAEPATEVLPPGWRPPPETSEASRPTGPSAQTGASFTGPSAYTGPSAFTGPSAPSAMTGMSGVALTNGVPERRPQTLIFVMSLVAMLGLAAGGIGLFFASRAGQKPTPESASPPSAPVLAAATSSSAISPAPPPPASVPVAGAPSTAAATTTVPAGGRRPTSRPAPSATPKRTADPPPPAPTPTHADPGGNLHPNPYGT